MRSPSSTVVLVLAILIARSAAAQERLSGSQPADLDAQWQPLGQIPVDQAGAGRRGYVLAPEGADVTAPGTDQFSFHLVAANNFYREQTRDLLIAERSETHTFAFGYRRGFAIDGFPRFEIGAQAQMNERDSGFLNGFITTFEDVWASMTGRASVKNPLRATPNALPLGTTVSKNGHTTYQAAPNGAGFGDLSLIFKMQLLDPVASTNHTGVAARLVFNIGGNSEFTAGNFAGVGLSVDQKLFGVAAFHGDVRANVIFDEMSDWNLPLQRVAWGFSAGPEVKLTRRTSLQAQFDGASTPYLPTGTAALDSGYGDLTIGVSHRFAAGAREVVAHLYARENMNLPFSVRLNADPDLAIGLKATIRARAR